MKYKGVFSGKCVEVEVEILKDFGSTCLVLFNEPIAILPNLPEHLEFLREEIGPEFLDIAEYIDEVKKENLI